ncbi:MAG: SRPBCC family protein [Candidatus Methylomirabilales bacterium]
MAALLKSRTLSVSINCDPKKLYEFVSKPENLPKWAKMFCRSIKKSKGEWIVETPQGPVKVKFSKRNDFGILDHYVSPSPGVEVFVPMRVVPNGSGSEVLFTLFQPVGMSDEKHAEDIRWVEQDLRNVRSIGERQSKR